MVGHSEGRSERLRTREITFAVGSKCTMFFRKHQRLENARRVLLRMGVRVSLVRPIVVVGRVMAPLPGIQPKVTSFERVAHIFETCRNVVFCR